MKIHALKGKDQLINHTCVIQLNSMQTISCIFIHSTKDNSCCKDIAEIEF